MTDNLSIYYTNLIKRFDKLRKRENYIRLQYGILIFITILLITVTTVSLLEFLFNLSTTGRTVLFFSSIIISLIAFAFVVIRPLLFLMGYLKSQSNYNIALRIGNYYPEIRDRLLDALQLYENKNLLKDHYSTSLVDASFNDLYMQTENLDFNKIIDLTPLRKTAKRSIIIYGLFILFMLIFPSQFSGALYRIANFNKPFTTAPALSLYLEPGNTEVLRGENVPILIRASGRIPVSITFAFRQIGQVDYEYLNLTENESGTFKTEIPKIKSSTEYYAFTNQVESEKYLIKVIDRPLIRRLQLTITPPGYTRLPVQILDESNVDIPAYSGSRASFEIAASKNLSYTQLKFIDSTHLSLTTNRDQAKGTYTITKNTSYHIELKDEDKLTNIDPVEYNIRIIPDEYPSVEIIVPGKNLDLTEEKKLDLLIRLKDDFGFSQLKLAYRLAQSKYEKPSDEFTFITIPLADKNQNQIETWYPWDLSPLHLVPEDIVAYYVEVFDNDNVNGPKSSRSNIFIIRLPSLEEVFADISDIHEKSIESMQNLFEETKQFKKELEDLAREMRKNQNNIDWQQKKKAEEMLGRYNEMKRKVDDISRSFDEMVKKMDENKLVTQETMEKYLELQRLMDELKNPELQDALRKLQEMMKQMSLDQMKNATEQIQMTETQFRQNLERTIELLKRIHIELKIDELIKRTEELSTEQEMLKEATEKTNKADEKKRDELAKKQEDLEKKMKNLQDETASLQKKMEEFPTEMPLEQMNKTLEDMKNSQTDLKMKMASSNIQSGDMNSAQKSQSEAQKDLDQMKNNLEATKMALIDNQMRQIVNQMRKQLENIIELSKREESLKDATKGLDPNSQKFRENAQRQYEIMNDLTNIANELNEVAKKSFAISPEMGREIGNALKEMSDAMKSMESRNPNASSERQTRAMSSLNQIAIMMQSAISSMMQGGKGGLGMAGLMSRLQQMAGMQGSLNMATRQATGMGDGGGELLSAQQQAEYQRLAAQQGALQKSIEELAREAKEAGEYSRLLGDLDQIAKDMQEVQSDLQQGNVNPNTLQKQERIFSRLLESARSMRERDYEKRRRADPGKDVVRASPSEIDMNSQEGKNKLRQELLKALENKYTRDYEELIKKYFEQLEKEEIPQR